MRGAEGAVCCSVGLQKQWYFRPLRPAPALPIINKNVYICPAAPAAVGDHAAGPSEWGYQRPAGRRAIFQTICDILRCCFRYLLGTNLGDCERPLAADSGQVREQMIINTPAGIDGAEGALYEPVRGL